MRKGEGLKRHHDDYYNDYDDGYKNDIDYDSALARNSWGKKGPLYFTFIRKRFSRRPFQ